MQAELPGQGSTRAARCTCRRSRRPSGWGAEGRTRDNLEAGCEASKAPAAHAVQASAGSLRQRRADKRCPRLRAVDVQLDLLLRVKRVQRQQRGNDLGGDLHRGRAHPRRQQGRGWPVHVAHDMGLQGVTAYGTMCAVLQCRARDLGAAAREHTAAAIAPRR